MGEWDTHEPSIAGYKSSTWHWATAAASVICTVNVDADVRQVAIAIMDEKIGDRVNVLNSARYRTRQRQERLRDLQLQLKQYGADDDDADGDSAAGAAGAEPAASGDGRRTGTDAENKGDAAKSADGKEDEEGQVINKGLFR